MSISWRGLAALTLSSQVSFSSGVSDFLPRDAVTSGAVQHSRRSRTRPFHHHAV